MAQKGSVHMPQARLTALRALTWPMDHTTWNEDLPKRYLIVDADGLMVMMKQTMHGELYLLPKLHCSFRLLLNIVYWLCVSCAQHSHGTNNKDAQEKKENEGMEVLVCSIYANYFSPF